MIWTLELASYLDDAPWPATKEELIDYAVRTGAPLEVLQNLEELEDSDEPYESMEEIWPDYPTDEDFFFEDDKEYEFLREPYVRLPSLMTDRAGSEPSVSWLGFFLNIP